MGLPRLTVTLGVVVVALAAVLLARAITAGLLAAQQATGSER